MSDLEDFLRKAAERRKQKVQGNASPSKPRPRPPSPPPVPPPQRREPLIADSDYERQMQAQPLSPHSIGQLRSNLPKQNHLAEVVDQADERMVDHVNQVFVHEVGHLAQGVKANEQQTVTDVETRVQRSPENIVGKEVLKYLSNPQTIRAAFIASEIFQRKF